MLSTHLLTMLFSVSCQLDYTAHDPSTFIFALKCVGNGGQKVLEEFFITTPGVFLDEFSLPGGLNRFSRIRVVQPGPLRVTYRARVATTPRLLDVSLFQMEDAGTMLPEVLPFLLPSRYCQSDRLRKQAFDLFGHLETPHAVATAIRDWIHANLTYVGGSSNETTSALETLNDRQGVCRDFAQLGIAFCRAMSIPARYATCYAHQLHPQDFHACFEANISGWWIVFDPTGLVPLNGLVRIATGRDAADAAVCTSFGQTVLISTHADCSCDDPRWSPIHHHHLARTGQALTLG